ncbi:hypothetical protein OPV22_007507 [Ensete ventricosum]|uniref:Uncharacterized protein n=1 Tax=Ensete ventricosum TaxID=4639 RepID=A0AAV8Q8S4_ENSVE|nr:hypothetical protein OPV22_007507 [Ensete ventricosum]
MTSSDSSTSVRVASPSESGESSHSGPGVSSSGASSGPPSPVDARIQRDLEVMMSHHDLDSAVTEGSLAAIRARYSIPAEYGLYISEPGQRPYSLDVPGMCISVDALEAGLRFPLHPLIEECLKRWRISPSQVGDLGLAGRLIRLATPPPYLSEEEAVLVGRLKGILSSSCAFKEMIELWLVEAGLSPASKDRMDLGDLRGMPRIAGGRAPPSRPSAREASTSPAREAPRASAKRPAPPPTEHAGATGKPVKRVKVLSRKHKSPVGEGGSRPRSKGKEPAASPARPEAPAESEEGVASPVQERPRSMKDLFRTKVYKGDQGYYALVMSDLGHQDPEKELQARWAGLKNSTKVWHTSSAAEEYERGILHPQLARELYTLPSEVLMARATKELVLSQHLQMALVDRVHDAGRLITFMDHRVKQQQEELDVLKSRGGPEAVAEAEERASRLQEELERIKAEKAEELLRHEAAEKELRGHLGDAHHLLKEARARARRMDDELLQSVKDLEQARAELPRTAVAEYKESLGFKEGLKRMGRVTYEYGYRVARARFRARHPDADVEEDPFTIYPEDDSVPMERRQDFDDSMPPES